MITLNNSNIDFGFEDESSGSKYSISLSRDTSNFVFRTDGVERMTIMKNGKVGIGTFGGVCDLDVNGTINASVYLINGVDISTSAITGDTSNYVRITSNILIGRIRDTSNYVKDTSNILVGSIVYTSNYVRDTSNILIDRVRNTSNYVRITSNILIDRIRDTSNYVKDTSNILVGSIVDTSNYVRDTSNILVGRIVDTSNYVESTSNILVGCINVTSNYIRDTSNILIDSISDTSNYIGITSNILVGHINNTSNYVKITSNILFGHINNTSNYVKDTSNILVGCINDTSNYVGITSNILVGRIVGTSNYVASTSNIFVGSIVDTSNYADTTNNILVRRIIIVSDTDNIFVGPINETSNYIGITSNILVGLINNTCNYTGITNNILVGLINNTCNYVRNTRDNLVSFINSELSTKSQWRYSNNNIYYNAGNAGIGTTNTISKLNIYSSIGSSSLLTLENKQSTFFDITGTSPTMMGTTGEYKYLIYTYTTETVANSGQTQYTINIPAGGIVCDILMVGGGGAGDGNVGSGGGGGAVYYGKNVKINEGSYIINVGRGGIPGVSNGFSTNGFGAIIKGGQTGNSGNSVNIASSAGAYLAITYGYNTIDIVTNSTLPSTNNVSYIDSLPILYNGNTGGKNTIIVNVPSYISVQKSYQAGGGGGAGTSAKATYYNSGSAEADGGDGVLVDILGVDLYWGGGGGGAGLEAVSGNGGLGGAGSGNGIGLTETSYEGQKSFYRPSKSKELDAAPHTGGGGGGKYGGTATTGGYGGSGIIIIKYLSNSSSSDIELISGVTSDNIIDYKIGNYNNIFKITSFKNGINTDNLVIDSNGYVGIGTLPPNYRLEVSECLATTKRGALDLLIKNKNLGMSSSIINTSFSEFSIINICARFNGSIWITGECLFALNCDIRIKEDIKDINDDSALQMILAIEPKTYKYIDNIENGNKKVYGFIAQQVQKVIPEAVSLENAYIPNIMMLADYNENIITLPYIPSKVVIKIKDKIKCYDINNNLVEVEITEIINNFTFKIKDLDKKYKNNKIFVYGTYVDDFYILSKEYIYTLNVGATQELYRQIKEQDNIIKSREEEINELEKQNKDLNEKYEMLLKELTLIKQRINR